MMFRLWPLGIVTLSVRFPLEMFSSCFLCSTLSYFHFCKSFLDYKILNFDYIFHHSDHDTWCVETFMTKNKKYQIKLHYLFLIFFLFLPFLFKFSGLKGNVLFMEIYINEKLNPSLTKYVIFYVKKKKKNLTDYKRICFPNFSLVLSANMY